MNKRIKKLWIKALRSGKYQQTQGSLKNSDTKNGKVGYCCLGVLCDVFKQETGKGRWTKANNEFAIGRDLAHSNSSVLPRFVREWAELRSSDPRLGRRSASVLNDSGKSFNEIADRIKKYL